jgi:hypothetical protein
MAIALNPIFPVVSAKPVAADLVLQPGAVIDARVLKVLENNFVRIAIANLTIDVLSEVPLQSGQALQLAVSQNPQGIKLAVVPPGGGGAATVSDVANPAVAQAAATAKPATPTPVLNDLQALAVSSAVQTAAARQTGLSQLFANLAAATGAQSLPPQVQQAVVQLFALQPELSDNLTGAKIQAAFEASGLFREKTLVSAPANQPQPAALPDLKSALIVLRQTLSVALASAGQTPVSAQAPAPQEASATAATLVQPPIATPRPAAPAIVLQATAAPAQVSPQTGVVVTAAPPLAPGAKAQEILPPLPHVARAAEPSDAAKAIGVAAAAVRQGAGAAPLAPDTFLSLIRNALQIARTEAGVEPGKVLPQHTLSDLDPGIARANVPPPPFRGAAPSAQPIAEPTLAADAPPLATVRQLLDDTDGAIARQTLLQVASLPDRADVPGAKLDVVAPRWSFEIPFATPQGTAVAQFEVARDGGGNGEEGTASKVWRARFSLDVEPAGPVHAIISLAGETTSVRMWAERPVTAAQLRANTTQLAQALRSAELEPGNIVIGEGEPPQAATAPAGHFVNRAS